VTVQAGDVVDLTCSGRGSALAVWNRRSAYLDLHVMTPSEQVAWEGARSTAPEPRKLGDPAAIRLVGLTSL
jgi:uncharacterized protein YfaP (DUF2135 family)